MLVMGDITMAIAGTVAAALAANPAMAQDNTNEAEPIAADLDRPVAEMQVAQQDSTPVSNIPPTRLQFQYDPGLIQEKAAQDKFLRIPTAPKPISYVYFNHLKKKAAENNQAGIYVGVVEDRTENVPSQHFRDIHKRATQLLMGNEALREQGFDEVVGAGDKGLSELYGAHVSGIFSIQYSEGDVRKHLVDDEMIGTDTPTIIDVPVEVGDIILVINDHVMAFEKDGTFIESLAEFQVWLTEEIEEGRHLYALDEYMEHKDAILLAQQERAASLGASITRP
ncbi:MAG: hypothetical protein AAGB29_13680 [Planctomycetota bacterium]